MRLFELAEKPRMLGEALVAFGHPNTKKQLPCLEGNVIFLPNDPEAEIFLLAGGTQLLLRFSYQKKVPTRSWNRDVINKTFTGVWLCGSIGKMIFLGKVDNKSFDVFIAHNQQEFFTALLPTKIMDEISAVSGLKTWMRYNFLFLIDTGLSIQQLELVHFLITDRKSGKRALFRDYDKAADVLPGIFNGRGVYNEELFLGIGSLKMPGFPLLELSTVHVIVSTKFLEFHQSEVVTEGVEPIMISKSKRRSQAK